MQLVARSTARGTVLLTQLVTATGMAVRWGESKPSLVCHRLNLLFKEYSAKLRSVVLHQLAYNLPHP